jgi:hypothetical protein
MHLPVKENSAESLRLSVFAPLLFIQTDAPRHRHRADTDAAAVTLMAGSHPSGYRKPGFRWVGARTCRNTCLSVSIRVHLWLNPEPALRTLDFRPKTLHGRGFPTLDFGLWVLDFGPWALDFGLSGRHSHGRPETHRRGQRLHSEARNSKNAPESTICGVLRMRSESTQAQHVAYFGCP